MRAEKGKTPAADLAARERQGSSNVDVAPFARPDRKTQCTWRRHVADLHAELIGSDRATAAGITARGNSPVLQLCRLLVAAGIDPGRPLHAHHGNVLCLIIRSIGVAAALTVKERPFGPVFERWMPFPTPPVRPPIAPQAAKQVEAAP